MVQRRERSVTTIGHEPKQHRLSPCFCLADDERRLSSVRFSIKRSLCTFTVRFDSFLAMHLQLRSHLYVSLAQLLVRLRLSRGKTAEMGGQQNQNKGGWFEWRRPNAAGCAGIGFQHHQAHAQQAAVREREVRRQRNEGFSLLQAVRF